HAKEVQLYQLGPEFLQRYRDIFAKLYREDGRLTLQHDGWGFVMGLVGNVAFYGAYAWIAISTVLGRITLGAMTIYLLVFKQGQAAVGSILTAVGGMYEDNLYLSTLYEYLEQPVPAYKGVATAGPHPEEGLRFDDVWFSYPGA